MERAGIDFVVKREESLNGANRWVWGVTGANTSFGAVPIIPYYYFDRNHER
jgi:hypothetical protein